MYVESIEVQKNNKRKIHLSDGVDFSLYKSEIRSFGIEEGMEITEEIYARLLEEVFIPRARRRAMYLLEKMDRSKMQLQGKLQEGGYPQEAIDQAIAYVESYHYLDDERLARSHIRFYQTSRSRMRMTQDLIRKGIDRDTIDVCMEEELEQSQMDLIADLMRKKNYDPSCASREEQGKMYRFLMQRGFSSADIGRMMRQGLDSGDYS